MTDRHAYCIIAHTDAICLQSLIDCIDDKRNDIFLVIDRKASSEFRRSFSTQRSRLYIIPKEKSIDVRWGDLSLVETELLGFKTALETGTYSYIHLLSGQDLPLKSQDEIHYFFRNLLPGTNLVGLAQGIDNIEDLKNKTLFYHFFLDQYRGSNLLIKESCRLLRKIFVRTQKIFRFHRHWNIPIYKGSEWVSITPDFARLLVEKRDWIIEYFKYVPCVDEIYKQTILMNSHLKDTIYDRNKDFAGGTRIIDWERGKPYTWREDDFEELVSSQALFARKFSSTTDQRIINLLKQHVTLH